MGRLQPVLRTKRGILCRDDKTLTLEDVCQAFTWTGDDRAMAASRGGAARCVQQLTHIREPLQAYAHSHGFDTDDARELLTIWTQQLVRRPVCKMCGAPARFNRQLCAYSNYCSPKCQNNDPAVKAKHEATNIQKYGVANAAKSDQVKCKQAETTTQRYGATCFLATDAGKKKARETCMARYGVPHSGMVPGSNALRRATMRARYGVDFPLQSKAMKDKFIETCTSRYGSPYPNVWKLKELVKQQRAEVYDGLQDLFPSYEIQCTRDSFMGLHEHENTWKCLECGSVFKHYGVPFCSCQRKRVLETALLNLVKEVRPDAIANVRDVLPDRKEIDVYVPALKLGFEFDGLYWHSELYHDKAYHIAKTEAAASVGVRLIHVFEDEWLLREDIVRAKISAMLGAPQTAIAGRKCTVRELNRDVADTFLRANHIQGPAISASVHLGLYSADSLVAVCTFGRIGGHPGWWYLERYATLRGFRVRGGCGKLLSYFTRAYKPELIRTFADRRWSVGGMYDALGFTMTGTVRPAYWYVKPNKQPIHRVHRFNLRRDVLLNELGIPDNGEPESELAARCGYLRIWDCGQLAYEMRP